MNELDEAVARAAGLEFSPAMNAWICDMPGELGKINYQHHPAQDWNALMAAVASEGMKNYQFLRNPVQQSWDVLDSKTNVIDYFSWQFMPETEALAHCIKAVVDKEK